MALTLPKLAVPKISLTRKQVLTAVGGVVILAAAGWFGLQYFEDAAPPPPPPAKPQAVTAAKAPGAAKASALADAGAVRDKLIADLLVASGLKQQLSQLPQKLVAGVSQFGKQHVKASPAVLKTIETTMADAFSAQAFQDRISARLKKDYDEKRLQALVKDFSAPATKRMIELEQAAAPQDEFTKFARSPAATRPTAQRASLLRRIDSATRASDLAVELAFSSMKDLAWGAAGGGAAKSAAVEKAIERQRTAATAGIRNATLLNLAFSYRSASDAELEEYAKFCEAENSKWLSGIVYASLVEEVQTSSAKAGERIAALAGKPAALASKPAALASKTAVPEAKPARSHAHADARECLSRATNKAIMACAEKYR